MSSHREAPEISKDPVADSTDLYAFVSPDKANTVTLIANYIPLETPAGGPNFYEFGDDVLYEIHIDNDGDGYRRRHLPVQLHTENTIPTTFLYNVGPIESLSSANWNRHQFYSVTRVDRADGGPGAGREPAVPAVQHRTALDTELRRAGQCGGVLDVERSAWCSPVSAPRRSSSTSVSIFDLGDLRPIANLHNTFGSRPGPERGAGRELPGDLERAQHRDSGADHRHRRRGRRADQLGAGLVERRHVDDGESTEGPGPRLGPRVARRHRTVRPGLAAGQPALQRGARAALPEGPVERVSRRRRTSYFANGVAHPELAGLLNVLYPGFFPNLAAYTKPRADLEAILLTGIPAGVVIATYSTFTGATQADMLRLNLAIPPATTPSAHGYPRRRRGRLSPTDDASPTTWSTIELQAIAGATISARGQDVQGGRGPRRRQ